MNEPDNEFEEPEGTLRWNLREEEEATQPPVDSEPSDFDFYAYVP